MNGVCGEKVLSAVANKSHAAPDPFVGGEEDPGPGWLRSRFMGQRWPRPGHEAACGRPECPVCQPQASSRQEAAE